MVPRALVLTAFVALVAGLLGSAGGAVAKPSGPKFVDFPKQEQKRVLNRIGDAPAPYRRLLKATYPRLKIWALFEHTASYVAYDVRPGKKDRYVAYLDIETREGGEYGDHLTTHELGHVIAHEWFDEADYERFFDLFRESPDWQDCFSTPPGYPRPCDEEAEILADQLAFYATGNLEFRSSYDIPPLADRPSMKAAIEAGGR